MKGAEDEYGLKLFRGPADLLIYLLKGRQELELRFGLGLCEFLGNLSLGLALGLKKARLEPNPAETDRGREWLCSACAPLEVCP